ncbi:hypothetical protein V6N13_061970 [Hibiscus sabdariffa]
MSTSRKEYMRGMNITEVVPENYTMPQATVGPSTEHPTPAESEPTPVAAADPEPIELAASEPAQQPAIAQQLNRMEA